MPNTQAKTGAGAWLALLAILIPVLFAAGCSRQPEEAAGDAQQNVAGMSAEHARKHLDPSYVCPMHPQIVRDAAGTCPICGMQLVEKVLEPISGDRPAVTLSAAVVQNLGVRTASVKRGKLWKYIRTQGTVAYDDDRILHVHPRAAGWIEDLYVETEGERVKRGDDLADYFSPAVLWAQVDYVSSLEDDDLSSFGDNNADKDKPVSLIGSEDLLRYLKVPEMYMRAMESTHRPRAVIPIKAPQGGVITMHGASEGMYAEPRDRLFTIVDLSEIWVMVDIYEHQIAWVKPGLQAEIRTAAYPGRSWEGVVEFVYPEVHPTTRTLQVRLEFSNPGEVLMPNMFVEAVIYGGPKQEALIIPREALIVTGEREAVVKALGEGKFQPVEVVTGMWRGDSVEVLSGLHAGDEIVVSGQFLIDSESSLKASFLRMSE
jgi:Cu(I)/Ag(I) efflux system membrane fusion protein